ncbi:MAG TPA: flagellar hook-basal body complex protein FliE [Edaphobacter sp.]|nr:flagellar hook-basal body complex protein FliE [Edaphobacter sp.]
MNGIGQIAGAVNSLLGGGGTAAKAQAETPFAGVFRSMVEQTSALDQKASQAVTGLLNGQGVEIHDAMIATQKADMAFELALQVRNKAVAAYQQMMGMQF